MNRFFQSGSIFVTAISILIAGSQSTFAIESDFEDLTLAPESFYNGSDNAGGFTSEGAFFNNTFDPTFGSWSGWSYSNTTDTVTPGFANQFSAFPGSGADGSNNYSVAFTFGPGAEPLMPGGSWIDIPEGSSPQSVDLTNTTYAALSMLDGDEFAKQFGGETGDDEDFFLLNISGTDSSGSSVGDVDFYLADYRFQDNSQDFIVDTWEEVDLSGLEGASRLIFALSSSDNNPQFGINTPAYFALDNLKLSSSEAAAVPESSSIAGVAIVGVFLMGSMKRRISS